MKNGPIIGARAPRTFLRQPGVKRYGVPLFYLTVSAFAAYFSATAFAQISVEPLTGTQGVSNSPAAPTPVANNILVSGYNNASASSPQQNTGGISLSNQIQLSLAEIDIGLMPAAQFFSEQTVTTSTPVPAVPSQTTTLSQPVSLATVPRSSIRSEPNDNDLFGNFWADLTNGVQVGASRSREIVGDTAENSFTGFVGAGAAMTPVYAGADEYHFWAKPVGHIEIFDVIRLSHQEGAELVPFRGLPVEIALGLNFREGRHKDARPVGLDIYDWTLEAGGEISVALDAVEIFVDVEKGLLGGNLGWEVETGLRSSKLRLGQDVEVTGQLSATWVDDTYMAREFGVSGAEATRTGLTVYAPSAGLRDATLSLEAFYYLSENFGLYAGADGEVLLENAMRSPIVKDDGNLVQLSSNLGLIYRF